MPKVKSDTSAAGPVSEKRYAKPDLRKGPKLEKVTAAVVGSPKVTN